MVVIPSPDLKPRRKWGWLFVAAFVVQAVILMSMIASTMSALEREKDLQRDYMKTAPRYVNNLRIMQLENEIGLLRGAGLVSSIAMLIGAGLGLRRPK
jgi:hypothetical protein